MSCSVVAAGQPAPQAQAQARLDDEITALALQLEEARCHHENSGGGYPADRPPDNELAFSTFQAEVQSHLAVLNDLRLAHSIAQAVDTDGQTIAEIAGGETQARQDRQFALQVDRGGGNTQTESPPPPYSQVGLGVSDLEEYLGPLRNVYNDNTGDHEEDEAGPSTSYTRRQGEAMDTLSQMDIRCSVCYESFQRCEVSPLQCGDVYCKGCLKSLFMQATKDETLFPLRCCSEPIPQSLVAGEMTAEELETFECAEIEFSTTDRTYCSNVDCGRFIPPNQITAGRAECGHCDRSTCSMCKNVFHLDDCPADPALQEVLALAEAEGWRRCYHCRVIVQLSGGCFHMT